MFKLLTLFLVATAAISKASILNQNCFRLNQLQPSSCEEIYLSGSRISGSYHVYPSGSPSGIQVFCDLSQNDGGWTSIHRQTEAEDGDVQLDFDLNALAYASGFGDVLKSFWLGLESMEILTRDGDQQIRFVMEDWNGNVASSDYAYFKVANASDNYRLSISGYGKKPEDAGDSMHFHDGMEFSTKDSDHDRKENGNCAEAYSGGWWYNNCYWAHPTGKYNMTGRTGMNYLTWGGYNFYEDEGIQLKRLEMKIRSRDFECVQKAVAKFGRC